MRKYLAITNLTCICVIHSLMAQEPAIFRLSSSSSVHMLLTDSRGRVTGCDPRGNPNQNVVNGIPHSNYSFESLGSLSPEDSGEVLQASMLLELGSITAEQLGHYSLMVIGRLLDSFYVMSELERHPGGRFSLQEFGVDGLIDKDQVILFSFDLATPPNKPVELVKLVNPSTLRQELRNAFRFKILGDTRFYAKLDRLLGSFEAYYANRDYVNARRSLRSFQAYLDRANASPTPAVHVSAYGYRVLADDIKFLSRRRGP